MRAKANGSVPTPREARIRAPAWSIWLAALLSGCVSYRESNPPLASVGAEAWTVGGEAEELSAFPPSVTQVLDGGIAGGLDAEEPADPAPSAEEVMGDLDPLGEVWAEMEAEAVARRGRQ